VHAWPHAPQLLPSIIRLTHSEEHIVSAPVHVEGAWHTPLTHSVPDAHAAPHPPQLDGSVARSTHVPPHAVSRRVQFTVGPVSEPTPSFDASPSMPPVSAAASPFAPSSPP
jgi:hypothetical protein